ncbi:amino acid deaminase [Bradyrhizobium sp. UFLA05-112]
MTRHIPRNDERPLDDTEKGIPGHVGVIPIDALRMQGWNLLKEDLPLPVAVLKEDAVWHNVRWMQRFIAQSGVAIAPHGKTTMSPALFDLQLAAGAWGITVATVHQLQVARRFGYSRIVMANQLVGRRNIDYVLEELKRSPGFEFCCLADSIANVERLADAARRINADRPLRLLVEIGYRGGRTGCRDLESALAVARAIAAGSPVLALAGIEGFEGLMHGGTPAESTVLVDGFLERMASLARACAKERLFAPGEVLLSAGGSIYYDLVAAKLRSIEIGQPTKVVLRSGCYITHDDILYRRAFEALRLRDPELAAMGGGLRPALEIWAYVQSRPEPEKAILGFGKRDASYDDPPLALKWFRPGNTMTAPATIPPGHRVTHLNDQHCHFAIPPDSPLAVGDMVAFGISHPCLTFDKWRVMQMVDDAYNCISAIRTYF